MVKSSKRKFHFKDLAKEDRMMLKQEEKKKARKRTRGPYRKSSRLRV